MFSDRALHAGVRDYRCRARYRKHLGIVSTLRVRQAPEVSQREHLGHQHPVEAFILAPVMRVIGAAARFTPPPRGAPRDLPE